MEFSKVITGRRSVRNFTEKKPDREVVEKILDLALYAPNAGNRQQTRVVVCNDKAVNGRFGKIHSALINNFNREGRLSYTDEEYEKSPNAFYNAPTVLYLLKPKNFYFSESDAYILADSICLAAFDAGLSSCIVGEVGDAFDCAYGADVLKEWGIPDGYKAFAYVLLGYNAGEYPKPRERKYAPPVWVG